MVRVAVGSMVDVAQRHLSLSELAAGLEGGRRGALGRTAPARGLALVAVEYESPTRLTRLLRRHASASGRSVAQELVHVLPERALADHHVAAAADHLGRAEQY